MSTGAEMTIRLYDVSALEDSRPSCDSAQSFAQAQNLRDEGAQKLPNCATLEENFFRLDGSFEPFPDSPQGHYWGLWSNAMSGRDCAFVSPPVLRIGFTQSHSSAGLTMRFYEREQDYCKHLRVWWMDKSGNIMSAKDFFPQSAAEILLHKVEGYYSLKIAFLKTSKPCRYLKLAGIDYGMKLLLSGQEISAAEILEEVDLRGSSVSINTLDMSIYSATANFSPLNPNGYFSLFQQNQKLTAYALLDDEKKDMGSFFLQSWEADGKNNVKLRAVDAIGLMDKVGYAGGIYVDTVAQELLQNLARCSGVMISTDPGLAQKKLNGHLSRCTVRQAVGQIALAIGGIVDSSRSETVRIYQMPKRPSTLIGIQRKFNGQRISLRTPVTGIDITAHRFTATGERYTAFEETLTAGAYKILFTEPTHTPAVTGAAITDAGANYLCMTVAEAGKVTVTGGRYRHSKQIISDSMTQQAANLADNRLKVEDATLISAGNSSEILNRMRSYYSNDLYSEFSIKLGGERVADMVVVESQKGESLRGMIESIETNLTDGCIAKVKISAQRIETLSSSYAGELYAGQRWGVL